MSDQPPTLYLRRAVADDVDVIYRWRSEVVAWLARHHPATRQWQGNYPRSNVERWVARGETFMASLAAGGEPVATVTSSSEGDPGLWTPFELATPARYMSKLTVDRRLKGHGIGVALIDWVRTDAARAGAEVVRIDVANDNRELHDLYRAYGFRPLRTIPDAPYDSGALFEIPAAAVPGVPVVELFDPFGREVTRVLRGWAASA